MMLHRSGKNGKMKDDILNRVNEVLKANGRQELNLEELENVVGGACRAFDDIASPEDLRYYVYEFIGSIEQTFGRDIAGSILESQYISYSTIADYRSNGLDALYGTLKQYLTSNGTL